MIAHAPAASSVIYGDRTTAGTILTIPANSTWCGDILVSASVTAAASATPNVTVAGANAAPVAGAVLHRLSITGLALTTVTDSATISAIVVTGNNAATLEFALGGATSASVVCNGFIL